VSQARDDGYQYVSTAAQLAAAGPGKLLGLFANEEMFQQNGDVYDPLVDLATMTQKALGALSTDPDGFFLLVEEEAVDEFAHANNSRGVLQAMERLDRAVEVAHSFSAAHPGTLVVVTGDHETGGLAVGDGDTFPVKGTKLHFGMHWTTTGHTAQDVPVSAYGPLADRFTGKHPNTYVHEVLAPILTR
jgi:alkaline phosphatase